MTSTILNRRSNHPAELEGAEEGGEITLAGRLLFVVAIMAVLFTFGGTLLPLLLHLLLLPLEYLELFVEHSVEHLLHCDTRTAQVITAWTGLLAFLLILAFVLRRCLKAWQAFKARVFA